jgi:hypothetical protein
MVLTALLPLLERRVLAAERQASAAERQEELLRQYLVHSDDTFRDLLAGTYPTDSDPVDVYAEHGSSRDLKEARLSQLQELYYAQHGVTLSDEQLVQEYERLYTEAEERLNGDVDGDGVTH